MDKLLLKHSGYLVFLSLLISFTVSCTSVPEKKPEPPPPVVKKKEVKPLPTPEPVVEKELPQPEVALLLSSQSSSYKDVANLLEKKLGDKATLYILGKNKSENNRMISSIQSSDRQQVVAIGLKAALAAASLKEKQVVFCQVLDRRSMTLATDNMKGVSAFPATYKLFRDWKKLSPNLKQVTVITGKGFDAYMKYAKKAAGTRGINLEHKIVRTDKEFLYATKNLPASNQGQWYFPDNRVLSRKVLLEALTYNAKEGKQSVVFSPSLLSLGGLFYTTVSEKEVSELVYKRLKDSIGKEGVPGKKLLPLKKHTIGINPIVAKQLGLEVPAAYRKYIYEW